MKTNKPFKVITRAGQRCTIPLNAQGKPYMSGNWVYVTLPNKAERQQHKATLIPREKGKQRLAKLTKLLAA